LRLPEKKMARFKANELQDLVQQIEDLIADLAHLQDPQIKELPNGAEQKLGEAKARIIQESGPPQA
jgi:ElaB/YqjD/DUF883 family membrane-anchored ribosome-binding protein